MKEPDKFNLIFKAFSDSRRRKILDTLKAGRKNTGELCELLPELDRCTVMLHLQVLEKAELIIVQRQGRVRWNYLNVLPIKEISDRWIGKFAEHSTNVLSQLKKDLESSSEKA